MKINKIAVFGAGVWGSVIAQYLAKADYKISLWEYDHKLLSQIKNSKSRHHPNITDFEFDKNIEFTDDIKETVKDADLIIIAISSKGIRDFSKKLKEILGDKKIPVISAAKGVEDKTYKTICEIIEDEIPHLKNHVMAFTGPSFAFEVAKNIPTKIVLAGRDENLLKQVEKVLHKNPIILEISKDRRGAEFGGALKNVLAIGCGILDGIGDGANTKAAMIVKAMQEMNEIMLKEGAKTETVYGIAGLGDVILTGMSKISRNRQLGEKLGQGMNLEQAKQEIGMVAEGANSVESFYHLIKKHDINAPIITAVRQIVCCDKNADSLIKAIGLK